MASAYRSSRDSGAPEGHGTMQAWYKDEKIAESNRTVLLEGNHYFPPESVDKAFLSLSNHTSVCGWKGTAYYYNVEVGSNKLANAAWYYADPKTAADSIKGRIAFWKGVKVKKKNFVLDKVQS